MKERPILFSGPMVRAILEGRKTQTRRIVKEPTQYNQAIKALDGSCSHKFVKRFSNGVGIAHSGWVKCPYGSPGDLLWVRETWQYFDWTEDGEPFIRYAADNHCVLRHVNSDEWGEKIWDIFCDLSEPKNFNIDRRASDRRWRPSIHMPRWASRITLRITDIRVERLQDISEGDAVCEGIVEDNQCIVEVNCYGGLPVEVTATRFFVPGCDEDYEYATDAFRDLWQLINSKRPGCSWDDNPWVWVISFDRI